MRALVHGHSRVRRAAAMLALAAAALLAPHSARAQAPADSSLDAYVRRLADSTDAYFREATAPPDTTGLDSTLVFLLAHPKAEPGRAPSAFEFGPWLRFNRGDGAVMGGAATIGSARRMGELAGRLAWANGPNDVLGRGEYRKRWRDASTDRVWAFTAGGGRETRSFNRDHWDEIYSSISAAVFGGDRHDYVRRDGWSATLERTTPAWHASTTWRDELESSLPVSATWTLGGGRATRRTIAPAAFGRVRELALGGGARVGRLPVTVEGTYATSGGATGSDLTYRRMRLAAAGDFALGRHVALAPQIEYGRLRGTPVPQEAFFLGGVSSLRSLDGQALRGSGKTFARVDAVLADDVLELLRIPHPPTFPVQVAAFAASGAVWGRTSDGTLTPYRDLAAATPRDWPVRREWLSEAGASVMWRPGLPEPDWYMRFDYTWPLGADEREPRWSLSFQRVLNLVKRVGD